VSRNAPFLSQLSSRTLLGLGIVLIVFAFGRAPSAEPFVAPNSVPAARVVTICDSEAIDAFVPRLDVVRTMVDRGITNFTHKATVSEAWLSLVSTQDIVGIKVYSIPGPNSGTRPAVVAGIIEGLLGAGLPPKHIVIWDRQATDLRLARYFDLGEKYGVRVMGSAQAGYDSNSSTNSYDSPIIGNLVWGDFEFGQKGMGIGRKSFVSKLVSREITKIINISPLLNHNMAGVSGNLYSLTIGSFDNLARFEADPGRLATAVPELYALPAISDHVVLNIVDALICQYEGEERGLLHYSATLDELRFSKDPVALDVLSLQELDHQRELAKAPRAKSNLELYSNASLLELGVSDLKRIQVEHVQ
jgi:uncharacterized protein DUF362